MSTAPNIDKPFPDLSSGWRTAWDRRWPMALYTLIVWACGGIVLAPLVTWILRSLAGYGDVIVGNYTIHLWLLSPRGMAYLLFAGSLLLFTGILQLGGLLQIAGSSGGSGVSARDALLGLVANRRSLLKLSLMLFLLCLPFVLIIAAGPGLMYLLLLTEHDINFYLTHHPPQWTIMLVVSGFWVLVTGGITIVIFIRSMFALPAWLDGARSVRAALKTSWGATRGRVGPLARIMLICIGSAVVAVISVNAVVFAAAGYLLDHAADTLEGVVRIMSGHVIVHVLLQWVLGFLGVIWITGVWSIGYRRCVHADVASEATNRPHVSLSPVAMAKFVLRLRVMIPVIAVLLLGSWLMSLWAFGQDVHKQTGTVLNRLAHGPLFHRG